MDARPGSPVFVSDHRTACSAANAATARRRSPRTTSRAFSEFINSHSNDIPALLTVLTRPRELTRKQLRELVLELDRAGFREAGLATAWREMTNQDIAARIVGYIRQAAIGDALHSLRAARRPRPAEAARLASLDDAAAQWLHRIGAQTKANLVVDRAASTIPT
jgi:type I restriction enzyme R subunit